MGTERHSAWEQAAPAWGTATVDAHHARSLTSPAPLVVTLLPGLTDCNASVWGEPGGFATGPGVLHC